MSRWFAILLAVGLMISQLGCSSAPIRLPTPTVSLRKGFWDRLHASARSSHFVLDESRAELLRDFNWPLKKIHVTSQFGQRHGRYHEGLDLRASHGTPVYAAQNGRVLYAAQRIRGYGKMVVLKHPGDFATIYAHNSKLLVKRNQVVQKGELIAYSGNTGKSYGPHLHFELRAGYDPVDPLSYLSDPPTAVASR
ncbi:MAG: M23 family metallopeptidase [Bdellovibrionia bacterium]